MKKLKVLHILNSNSYSGAENVVITIINNMKDKVEGIYLSREGSIRKVLEENNIQFYGVEKLSVRELKRICVEVRPDIIHAHDFTAGIVSASSIFDIPIINHLHNNSPWIKKVSIKSIVYGLSCFRYQSILTVSKSVMDEFIFGKYFGRKSQVIGNPICVEKIVQMSSYAEIKDSSDIVFLGRLTSPKNPLFFLEIMYELRMVIPNVKVTVIGDGELRSQIETKIEELDLKENINLYGFQKNPYGLLRAGKILCMPSLWEGFGLAAVEAFALGKPVVAAPVGGLKDLVTEDAGKLCETKEMFVNELIRLLSDKDYYEKKSEAAQTRANELDNMETYISLIYKKYVC